MSTHQSPPSEDDSRRKTTLFCPGCGYENDVTGDWNVRTEDDRRIYDCPVCTTTITKRLRKDPLPVPND